MSVSKGQNVGNKTKGVNKTQVVNKTKVVNKTYSNKIVGLLYEMLARKIKKHLARL